MPFGQSVPPGSMNPFVVWPGVVNGITSARISISHGATPNIHHITTNAQSLDTISVYGDLVFGDGINPPIVMTGCRLKKATPEYSTSGFKISLEIEDRRWRWQNGTFLNGGKYNQQDTNGKFVPWTIRSPVELALLCLEAMGETNYLIEGLPTDNVLSQADAPLYTQAIRNGVPLPNSQGNPTVDWESMTPIAALTQLADIFGCRVIYQPFQNRLLIARVGVGADLPDAGSLNQNAASIKPLVYPAVIGIHGAPRLFQVRLALEPVLPDWPDGSLVPINHVSYAPRFPGNIQPQITRCEIHGPTADSRILSIIINERVYTSLSSGIISLYSHLIFSATFGVLRGFTINLTPNDEILITGRPGEPFSVQTFFADQLTSDKDRFDTILMQQHAKGADRPDWTKWIGNFEGLRAPNNDILKEVKTLAKNNLWKTYRVINSDVTAGHLIRDGEEYNSQPRSFNDQIIAQNIPIFVAGYGVVDRRQLELTQYSVEQIQPLPANEAQLPFQDLFNAGNIPTFYDGTSRNKNAVIYGNFANSIAWRTRAGGGNSGSINSSLGQKLPMGFTIDREKQTITFNEQVYRQIPIGGVNSWKGNPYLVLDCAVMIRDIRTNDYVRPRFTRFLPGGTGPERWTTKPDLILNSSALYRISDHFLHNKAINFHELLNAIPPAEDTESEVRATQYLNDIANEYQQSNAKIKKWNGIVPIDVNGLIQQTEWLISMQGVYTNASTNTEFHPLRQSYFERRKDEIQDSNTDIDEQSRFKKKSNSNRSAVENILNIKPATS
jgi:hypothetical protein